MTSAECLRPAFGRTAPTEVLENICSFGFHIWFAEPWSWQARAKEQDRVYIPRNLTSYVDSWILARVLCAMWCEAEHDGRVCAIRIAQGPTTCTLVPLSWHTLAVVHPWQIRGNAAMHCAPAL
jgi:hypothetical protein